MAPGQVSLHGMTWRDLRYYQQCPRLLAAWCYLALRPQAYEATPRRASGSPQVQGFDAHVRGAVGEALVELMLREPEEPVEGDAVASLALADIERRGTPVTPELVGQVEEAVRPIMAHCEPIRANLEDQFGRLELLGRGTVYYGHAPGHCAPDFVTRDHRRRVVLVEAKNVARLTGDHTRQAEWYNAAATIGHLLVEWQPDEEEEGVGALRTGRRGPQSCVLVNVHDGDTDVVETRAALTPAVAREIARVKRLGFQGLLPEADCASTCRCRRLLQRQGLDLPEGNDVAAAPLPLVVAQAMVESGADLELRGLHMLARRLLGWEQLRELRGLHFRARRQPTSPAAEHLAGLLGIPLDRAVEVLESHQHVKLDYAPIKRELASTLQETPYLADTPGRRNGLKAQVTRNFTPARDSTGLVRRSVAFWDKLEG